jgi:hypothetical protein
MEANVIPDPPQTASNSSHTATIETIYLHVLRKKKDDESFKIKASFTDDIKLKFDPLELVNVGKLEKSFIFTLALQVFHDQEGRTVAVDGNFTWLLDSYELYLARKDPVFDKKTFDCIEKQKRIIYSPRKSRHTFHFDVKFEHSYTLAPLGESAH